MSVKYDIKRLKDLRITSEEFNILENEYNKANQIIEEFLMYLEDDRTEKVNYIFHFC